MHVLLSGKNNMKLLTVASLVKGTEGRGVGRVTGSSLGISYPHMLFNVLTMYMCTHYLKIFFNRGYQDGKSMHLLKFFSVFLFVYKNAHDIYYERKF